MRGRFLPFLLLLIAMPALSLDWPVRTRLVTGTFGEDRGDHFHNGIDIDGGAQEVHPVLPGELVFRYDESEDYTSLPRGLGSFVVLRHAQDILSVYCNLASGSLGPVKARYEPTDVIGIIGETGHAEEKHLHFSVYDGETGSSVNPLAFLPPVADTQAPTIRAVFLSANGQSTNGQPLALVNGAVTHPGRVEILAEVYDLRQDVSFRWPMAPYTVSLSLDGKEVARVAFDSLRVSEGRMVVGGTSLSREDVYRPDGLLRCGTADLRAGESRLRLTARDFAGNETVREIAFTVAQQER